MAVAETMLELTDGEEIEAFYLAKGFFETLDKYLSDEFLLKELELMYHKILTNTNGNLYRYFLFEMSVRPKLGCQRSYLPFSQPPG